VPKVDSFPFPSRESEERYNKLCGNVFPRERVRDALEREFEKGQQNQTVGNPQIRANQFVLFQKKKFIIKKKQTKNGM
jgi:hypothetical protein